MTDVNLSRLVGQLDAEQLEELQAGIERRLSFLDGQEVAGKVAAGYPGKVHWTARRGGSWSYCGVGVGPDSKHLGTADRDCVTCKNCLTRNAPLLVARLMK